MPGWLDALREQGLLGLPYLWTADGTLIESDAAPLTATQRERIAAIFAAHADERPFVVAPPLFPPMEVPPVPADREPPPVG